jgi:GNAT superfamily N-acetyltransferase
VIAITETPLTSALKRTLYRWGPDIFGVADMDTSGLTWRSYATGFLLTVDGAPASYFRALTHVCDVDGRPVTVGGLGGLVTLPEYQRRGYGSRLVRAVLVALRDRWHVDAALAFCLDTRLAFYRSLGAEVIPGRVTILATDGPRQAPFHTLWWPFRAGLWPVTTVNLRSPLW